MKLLDRLLGIEIVERNSPKTDPVPANNTKEIPKIKVRDPEGNIIEIDAFDNDKFDWAMSHKDWCLVF